jgi:hypothetical protein
MHSGRITGNTETILRLQNTFRIADHSRLSDERETTRNLQSDTLAAKHAE